MRAQTHSTDSLTALFFLFYHAIHRISNKPQRTFEHFNLQLKTNWTECVAENRFKKWTTSVTQALFDSFLSLVPSTRSNGLSYSLRSFQCVCVNVFVCFLLSKSSHIQCCCFMVNLFFSSLCLSIFIPHSSSVEYFFHLVLSCFAHSLWIHRQTTLFQSTYLCFCAYVRKLKATSSKWSLLIGCGVLFFFYKLANWLFKRFFFRILLVRLCFLQHIWDFTIPSHSNVAIKEWERERERERDREKKW